MIIDVMENVMFYESMAPNLAAGVAKVKELGPKPEVGRYEFDGGFLLVQEGETKPQAEGKAEVHRKFIDVQIVLEGSEEMGWAPLSQMQPMIPYDESKDAEFLQGEENVLKITAGMFYMAFPKDAHKPTIHTTQKQSYRKIVMKLPVAE